MRCPRQTPRQGAFGFSGPPKMQEMTSEGKPSRTGFNSHLQILYTIFPWNMRPKSTGKSMWKFMGAIMQLGSIIEWRGFGLSIIIDHCIDMFLAWYRYTFYIIKYVLMDHVPAQAMDLPCVTSLSEGNGDAGGCGWGESCRRWRKTLGGWNVAETYCGWKCFILFLSIYRLSTIQGGAWFLPSTVGWTILSKL